MRGHSGYLRAALAVLALIGQLTPAVALPLAASAKLPPLARVGSCGSADCACSAIQRCAAGCCADLTPPKVKGCCESPPKPKPVEPDAAKPKPTPIPHAQVMAGGKCKCDKPAPLANAEPAAPQPDTNPTALDTASEPHAGLWAAVVTVDPLPPPFPPPRA